MKPIRTGITVVQVNQHLHSCFLRALRKVNRILLAVRPSGPDANASDVEPVLGEDSLEGFLLAVVFVRDPLRLEKREGGNVSAVEREGGC